MSAKSLLWAGSVVIFVSIVLQGAGLFFSSLPLALVGLGLNGVSVPLTILQGYRSAIEEQQRFEQESHAREQSLHYEKWASWIRIALVFTVIFFYFWGMIVRLAKLGGKAIERISRNGEK